MSESSKIYTVTCLQAHWNEVNGAPQCAEDIYLAKVKISEVLNIREVTQSDIDTPFGPLETFGEKGESGYPGVSLKTKTIITIDKDGTVDKLCVTSNLHELQSREPTADRMRKLSSADIFILAVAKEKPEVIELPGLPGNVVRGVAPDALKR